MIEYRKYAIDAFGQAVFIDDVPTGKACGCFCPTCKSPLCAKNAGHKRIHHFAHLMGSQCSDSAYETDLHILAKKIIREKKCIMSPEGNVISLQNVKTEFADTSLDIVPDAEGIMNNGERLLIEFFVTHKVDKVKREKILANNLKCIEIDINYQEVKEDSLTKFLISENEHRNWITESNSNADSSVTGDSELDCSKQYTEWVVEYLKDEFERKTLWIWPETDWSQDFYAKSPQAFNLKDYRYCFCEDRVKHNGFKSDILLSRDAAYKGWISINIRRKERSWGFRYPKDLRIIDIILPRNVVEQEVPPWQLFNAEALTSHPDDIKVLYYNFKYPHRQ